MIILGLGDGSGLKVFTMNKVNENWSLAPQILSKCQVGLAAHR